jgi:hypothetical protein
MDNSFHRRQGSESGTQQKIGFSASLQIFTSLLPLMRHSINWLASLTRLTEEEQEEAGIYSGHLGDE